jgi:hypothetical protein
VRLQPEKKSHRCLLEVKCVCHVPAAIASRWSGVAGVRLSHARRHAVRCLWQLNADGCVVWSYKVLWLVGSEWVPLDWGCACYSLAIKTTRYMAVQSAAIQSSTAHMTGTAVAHEQHMLGYCLSGLHIVPIGPSGHSLSTTGAGAASLLRLASPSFDQVWLVIVDTLMGGVFGVHTVQRLGCLL